MQGFVTYGTQTESSNNNNNNTVPEEKGLEGGGRGGERKRQCGLGGRADLT
jgi:hypothetical protein